MSYLAKKIELGMTNKLYEDFDVTDVFRHK